MWADCQLLDLSEKPCLVSIFSSCRAVGKTSPLQLKQPGFKHGGAFSIIKSLNFYA
jgi:hypothetical protein